MKMNIKNMKTVWGAWICLGLLVPTACSDMFETDSTSVVFESGNRLDSPNDSLYSIMGILAQIQKLGDRYVLMGELRGDLMETTVNADVDLQEISKFEVSASNQYKMMNDYYQVINNCNYAIAHMDTALVDYEDKVMIPEFAQIKVLRAWTYWQLALLCGEVSWIETPILDLEASLKDYPQKNQEQLAELLIEDLKPYIGVRDLNYGSVDGLNLDKVFIPVDMLLGDLYLFLNQYANAATAYYRLIKERELMVTSMYRNSWLDISRRGFSYFTHTSGLSYASSEVVSSFVYSSDAKAYHPLLLRMSYNDKAFIAPAQSFVDEMSNALYVVGVEGKPTVSGYCDGDMRGQAILAGGQVYPSAYGSMTLNNVAATYICKFFDMDNTSVSGSDPENEALGGLYLQRTLPLYRVSHVYLRLAEALNRLEKPTMAFSVLKYGLNATTLENPNRVKQSERKGEIYTDFTEDIFADNVGTATRGRGNGIPYDNEFYIIPDFNTETSTGTLEDSILFVEDCIVDEMAAETCFEGNRFFDLLRVARHRNQYPAYMAKKVSKRFGENAERMEQALMEEERWYMK